MTRTMYLPMEVKHRELEGKILLATQGCDRGYSTIIGSMGMILRLFRFLPKGVYVSKDIYRRRHETFRRILALGHELVSWDEEGLIFRTSDTYLKHSASSASLELCRIFFTWGNYQVSILRRLVDEKVTLVPAGNPRLDLLRPEHRARYSGAVEELRKRHGRFVLVDTNFGHANNIRTREELLAIVKAHSESFDEESRRGFNRFVERDQRFFAAFLEMIPKVADSLPDGVNLVVRPHPIEKIEPYLSLSEASPRIRVEREGGVIPWLLAAETLIHNSCTTGIESLLLDRPSFAYEPFEDPEWELNVANELSERCESVEVLIEKVGRALEFGTADLRVRCLERARRFIASVEGRSATETILDAIDGIIASREHRPFHMNWRQRLAVFTLGTLGPAVKGAIRKIIRRSEHAYDTAKFSGLDTKEVAIAVEMLGRPGSVEVKRIAKGVFLLSPDSRRSG